MSKKFEILVAGELNPDLILSDPNLIPQFGQRETLIENAALTIGSSNAIFACGAARLGLRVGFIGVVGNDLFGRFMLDALGERGVDVSNVIVDPTLETGLSVILNRITDRAILTHLGTINALRAEHIADHLLEQSRHLHVASYFLQTNLQPGLSDLFRRAQDVGVTTSLDTNWDPAEAWTGIEALLSYTTVFLPNEKEALSFTGLGQVEQATRKLATMADIVAVKMGSKGSLACQAEELVQVPSIPVTVADTVGAGDSFDAGLIYGFLNEWPLEKSLKLAVICGSLSTRKHGGTAAQPALDEALEAMDVYMIDF